MSNKNKEFFSGLGDKVNAEVEKSTKSKKEDDSLFAGRQRAAERNKKNITRRQYWVSPDECRMWSEHDRDYALLDEVRCEDLIRGFREMNGQQFAAVVRKLTNDSDYKYEVICGARRHWTASYLGMDFLVEPREMDDEEAFRLSDIENRDRTDICDYERAVKYKKALKHYYDSQKQMATRLECDEAWLSRFLKLADFPQEIIRLYKDVNQIKTAHSKLLSPLLNKPTTAKRMLAYAKQVADQQFESSVLVKNLKQAAEDNKPKKTTKSVIAEYSAKATGKPMVTVKKKGRAGLEILVDTACGADQSEVEDAIRLTLKDYFK